MPRPTASSRGRPSAQPARAAAASSTASPRGSCDRWRRRSSSGSTPVACAISSTKLSAANTLAMRAERAQRRAAPHGAHGVRSAPARRRSRSPAARCARRRRRWRSGMSIDGGGSQPSATCQAPSSAGVALRPGRRLWPGLQTSWRQRTMRPSASSPASRSTAIAGPNGEWLNSSSRLHSTRTVRPGTARASQAASKATSSAPLWP